MYATGITDTVTLGDVVVTIKKLPWKKLEEASEVKTEWALAKQAKLGRAGQAVDEAAAKKAEADAALAASDPVAALEKKRLARYATYDRGVILRAGVKHSSDGVKLPGAIDDYDEQTAQLLHERILDLSLPPLEDGAEETARKNA